MKTSVFLEFIKKPEKNTSIIFKTDLDNEEIRSESDLTAIYKNNIEEFIKKINEVDDKRLKELIELFSKFSLENQENILLNRSLTVKQPLINNIFS